MEFSEVEALAAELGFSHTAPLNPATLSAKQEVRDMCSACKVYNTRWSCPPGCGDLSVCAAKMAGFHRGILVQTVGDLEDEFDGEAMMETEATHKGNFLNLWKILHKAFPGAVALGSGCCKLCKSCSYPDAPCRFPEKMVSSMEAYGLLVMEVCKANDLPYYYGKEHIAYTSCFLLD